MAISFVGFSSNKVASGTSIGVVAPTGLAAGNLLIAMVNVKGATENINTPTGWTLINGSVINQSKTTVACFYKVAAVGDVGATLTFTYSASAIATAVVVAYSGVDQNSPLPSVGSSNGTTNTSGTWTNGGISISNANDQIVSIIGIEELSSVTYTVPTGYTQRVAYGYNTSNYESILIADKTITAAGASGTTTWDASANSAVSFAQFDLELQAAASDLTVAPTAIASAEAFGTDSISGGALTISPTTIASAEAFGTASLSVGGTNPVLLRSSSGSTVNGNGPVSVPAPGGVAAGDVLLAIVNQYATSITSITPPSGWTAVDTMQTFSTNNSAVQAFYKVATANEPASYTFTGNGTNLFEVAAIVLAYENADNTTPINAYAYNSGQATSATAASISTTVNNCLIVTLLGVDSSTNINSFTSASGWAVESSTTVSNAQAVVVAETQATSGSAGGENIAWDSTLHNWGGWTLSLAPVPTSSNQSLSPTAIASVEAFGTITVTAAYSVNASGNNIASAESFGTASIDPEAYITGPPIASSEAFGSDTVIYDQFVSATAIASSELFGSDSLSTAYSISATNIASSESFGTDSVTTQSSLSPSSIATLEGLGTDSVTTANSITASAIPSAEAFGIVVLGAAIVPSSIASAERFGSDTLTTTASVTVSSIPSAEAFGATTMGTVGSIAPQPITSAESFGTDTVVAGPVTVAENSIPSAESFGTASITTAATISVSSIPSSEAFGTDRLDRNVTVASIPSSESMGSDSLTVVTVISPSAISSGEAFGTTQITTGGSIAVYTIPSAESFGSAVIVYDQKITIASIGSAESFGSDTVVAGAVTVSPPGVPLDSNVWAPSVTLVDIIGPTTIASSDHFGLAVIDVSIAVTPISSSESVPAPDVLLNNIFVDAISSAESFGTAIIGFDTRLQSNERYLIVASDRSRIVEASDRTRIVEASDRSRIVEADERTTVIEATVRNRVITG